MLSAIVIIVSGLLLSAIIIRPFWGVLLLWPVLLLYPHALTQDLLPYNIGFDDLFVAFVFVVTLVRCLLVGQFRFGTWGLFVLTFWFLNVISTFYGVAYENIGFMGGIALKYVMKRSTIAMVAFIVLNGVEDLNQLPRVARWFLISSIGLSILAILQFYYPEIVAPFYQLQRVTAGGEVWRATGTTRGAWEIGGVLGVSIIISIAFLVLARGVISRPLAMVCAMLSVVAIILSRSRSGWVLVSVGAFTILALSKKPVTAIIMVAVVGSIIVAFPFLAEMTVERVEDTRTFGGWSESVAWRFRIWKIMLTNITFGSGIIGVGRMGAFARYGYSAHNLYVSALAETGVVGVCYFILLAISLWRRTWSNISLEQNLRLMAIWKGIFVVNIAILFYSIPVDTLDVDLVAKVLFFFWSFLYLRDYVATGNYGDELYDETSYGEEQNPELRPVYEY
jgi:O-antigen ligase